MAEEMCACGKPLHYTRESVQRVVEDLVKRLGSRVSIQTADGIYLVQRHYIALHGVAEDKLPDLAKRGIVEKVG